MATKTSTTAPRAVKAPFWHASYYGLQFIALLNAWGEHIHAEQALTRAADPGARHALAWAESSLPKFHDTLLNTLEAIPAEPLDLPLRRMTILLATLVRENRASAFDRYETLKSELAPFFLVPGDGAAADEVRKMLAAAERRFALMARLPLYRTEGVAQDALPELIAA
ncbi:hypothetical protein [Paracoccus marcusii]|uniref:Uncharacterized protein n=1 Tax=Paracoccus marcusii TaxID=59779 RepID=A0ABY7UQ46_9RHOB|nr:hypothetical protein [Paracoccus marcusii]WDA11819.1 hypothetical protein PRL19_10980 [Paracoccus marcusii]